MYYFYMYYMFYIIIYQRKWFVNQFHIIHIYLVVLWNKIYLWWEFIMENNSASAITGKFFFHMKITHL